MSEPLRPVIVFNGRNEMEAQMARDILSHARIPILHLPSLSTGVFGVSQTTRVAVPQDQVEKALEALREGGMEGHAERPPTGLAEFRETARDRLPPPRLPHLPGSRLNRVLIGLAVAIVAVAILLILTRP
jgi:hypothetical protein